MQNLIRRRHGGNAGEQLAVEVSVLLSNLIWSPHHLLLLVSLVPTTRYHEGMLFPVESISKENYGLL